MEQGGTKKWSQEGGLVEGDIDAGVGGYRERVGRIKGFLGN